MCEAMRWTHLPVAGGLYDQDPALLDAWQVIWHERGLHQQEQDAKRERESRKRPGPNRSKYQGTTF